MDSKILKRIEKSEHGKYEKLYSQGYGSTGYQRHISEYVQWTAHPGYKILDMGCGRGVAVKYLLKEKFNAFGVDITLRGCAIGKNNKMIKVDMKRFIKAPLWKLPYRDDEFDYTFSADVMEHIPPGLVEEVINEIFRVTSKQTLHVIATRPSDNKVKLHLTVESIWWWREIFQRYNKKGIKCIAVDCDEFLLLHEKKAKEMEIPVKCTCDRVFDNKPKLERHLKIKDGDARHLPDLNHKDTHLLFR